MKKFVGIGFRHALRTVHAASSYRAPCYAAPFHAAHSGASRLLHTAPPLLSPAGKEKEGEEATAVAGFGDYYSVLSLDRDCSAADVKASYVKIARACHPDVTDSTEAAASFQRAARAHETLIDDELRRGYDATLSVDSSAAKHKGPTESQLEAELRILIQAKDVDAAIQKWVLAGSNLKLLLHVLEACFRAKIVPSDLEALLNHLHATEPKPPDGASSNSSTGSSSGGGNGTTAVQ